MPEEVDPMQLARSKSPALLAAFAAVFLAVGSLLALPGYTLTGTGVRVRTIGVVNIDVYRISHYMDQLPATKSKEAVIDMDTGKKFVWTMLRDVDRASIVKALRDACVEPIHGHAEDREVRGGVRGRPQGGERRSPSRTTRARR